MVFYRKVMGQYSLETLLSEASNFFSHARYSFAGGAIVRKRPKLKLIFSLVGWASQSSFGNMAMLTSIILFYYPFRRPVGESVFQYGMSANNIRSFHRINTCLRRPELDLMINGKRLSFLSRLSCLFPLSKLWYASNTLKHQRAVSSFSHAQLVITSAAWLIYGKEDFSKIDVVCVASDHSPITMALLHIARSQRIKTCYLQHAPVTNYFPPLNYDLAILFDRQSAGVYEEAASSRNTKSKGKVIILPPFNENAKKISVRESPYRVGIFLSYLFDKIALSQLITSLLQHPKVMKIELRRHPKCKADISGMTKNSFVHEPKYNTVKEFAGNCDVLLVPNSGVAIESLHLGAPTFYTPGMDYTEDDYYGFVKGGILPIFSLDILDHPNKIAACFDRNWLEKFTVYDETSAIDLLHSQNEAGRAFQALIKETRAL